MSRTKHARKTAWNKRFPSGAMKAAMQSPRGTIVEYVGALTQEQFDAIFNILFPRKKLSGNQELRRP